MCTLLCFEVGTLKLEPKLRCNSTRHHNVGVLTWASREIHFYILTQLLTYYYKLTSDSHHNPVLREARPAVRK